MTSMGTTMMILPDQQHHAVLNLTPRRIVTSSIDLSMSLFSNTGMGYNIPFPQTNFNYNLPNGHTIAYETYAQCEQQALASAAPLYTVQTEMPVVQRTRFANTRTCEPLHVKVEDGFASRDLSLLAPGDVVPGSDGEATFGTDVDTLMRAIQTKAQIRTRKDTSSREDSIPYHRQKNNAMGTMQITSYPRSASILSGARARKTYQCSIATCAKLFYQKTHLEIHTRAHTGYKPFLCKEPSCGQRFSQLGNLKTHERRHTGERPYSCEACGKRFAQRGNVRAHRTVHEQTKPFPCRLEECGKQFTQLGNLKSHQNKFHADALQQLTAKFAAMREGDTVSAVDKELWEYFSTLYKNSNKGIKGRGKDRRISTATRDLDSVKREDSNGSTWSTILGCDPAEALNIACRQQDNQSSESSVINGH